ncbi:family 43 glycosylhydrolase [Verrucomicrobiota bacterium]
MKTPFETFSGFTYSDAIPYEEGVTRRDPSPVIEADGTYYVWYSRTHESADGYSASVWYAISPDGTTWQEAGEAIPKGPKGAFDEHAVFTPTILVADGKYFLFYTAVPEPFTNDKGGSNGTRTAIGVVSSDSPGGPWHRMADPVLRPSDDPEAFDSMRIDDTCFIVRSGEYWMYYKGRQMNHTAGETKMGLAIAKSPTGPYVKHHENPVLDSGHEVCVWPHGNGVGCMVCNVGPQGNTLQHSDDGVHFRKIADVVPPKAPGPFRADGFAGGAGPGVKWGISMEQHPPAWPHLVRFDCDLRSTSVAEPEHRPCENTAEPGVKQ